MKAKTNRFIFRWHRRIGITSAVFVITLCVTGLLLMFSSRLGLDRKLIGGGLVAKVYKLAPSSEPLGVKIFDDTWVVMIDQTVYVADRGAFSLAPPFLGAALAKDNTVSIQGGSETITVLLDGRLVERVTNTELPTHELSKPVKLPQEVSEFYKRKYAGRGLPASRVLLDIHTGRIFGAFGTWVMILATLLLLFLSLSGIIMWSGLFKHKGKYKRRW